MKAGKWVGVGVIITLGMVMTGLVVIWLMSGFGLWHIPGMAVLNNRWIAQNDYPCEGSGYGMMGGRGQPAQCDGNTPGSMTDGYSPADRRTGESLSLDDAYKLVDQYLANLNNNGLEIAEVMEFDKNFYAIVSEKETGRGAMEVLVDKLRGTVSPEMGPNMMWNAKYGTHGRGMMGQQATLQENRLSDEEAVGIAQAWLDDNLPGVSTEGHADPFYGYYTIYTLKDGEINGMLSVHGSTGQVWYHSWHGDFIQMREGAGIH